MRLVRMFQILDQGRSGSYLVLEGSLAAGEIVDGDFEVSSAMVRFGSRKKVCKASDLMLLQGVSLGGRGGLFGGACERRWERLGQNFTKPGPKSLLTVKQSRVIILH